MNSPKRSVNPLIIFLSILLCIELILDREIVFNTVEQNTSLFKLNSEQAKWESKNTDDYIYDAEYWIPLQGICHARITVQDGKITDVLEKTHGGLKELRTPIILSPVQWDNNGLCSYGNLTIPEVFERMPNGIYPRTNIHIEFDSEYGFVTRYYGNQYVGWGLFGIRLTESEFSYTFSDFESLEQPVSP